MKDLRFCRIYIRLAKGERKRRSHSRQALVLVLFLALSLLMLPMRANATQIFFDDFESDLGWTVNPNGDDTATTGMWERGNPESTTYQLGSTVSGSNDLVTGRLAGDNAGSYDIDGGDTTIRSPAIALPTISSGESIVLSFSYYLAYGSSSTDDYLRVYVVGSTTTQALEELGAGNTDYPVWARASVNLNSYAGQTIYLRIEAADAAGRSYVEAAIDDVLIETQYVYDNTTSGTLDPQPNCGTELLRTFNVTADLTITDLDVGLNLDHTWRGDVRVRLVSPASTSVTLIELQSDSANNFDLLLDNSSGNAARDGNDDDTDIPIYGDDRTAAPDNALSAFNGESAQGTWTLALCNYNTHFRTLYFNSARLVFEGSPLSGDWGDAPDTYGTLSASGGPYHTIVSGLYMGSAVDIEGNGQPGAAANGDDTTGDTPDDEDGVASFAPLTDGMAGQTYNVTVAVHNTTGSNATLVGWIDFDRGGTFANSESASVNVPNNTSGNVVLAFTVPEGVTAGTSYARFRLTTDAIDGSNPGGAASDGEVEDYVMSFAAVPKISGMVFRDYDADGVRDSGEPGVPNITVTAYDDVGNTFSTTTDADGNYVLTGLTNGTRYRLEFTGVPSYLKPGPYGVDSETTVVFATNPATNVDVGVNNPTHYCDENPQLCTPIAVAFDTINGPYQTSDAFAGVSYTADGTSPAMTHRVPAYQMGTAYGLAWQAQSETLLASSYVKTSAGLGPGVNGTATTGGIYQITPDSATTANATLFIDLYPIVDTGPDPHPAPTTTCVVQGPGHDPGASNKNCWIHDGGTFATVGKRGLGDLEFNADQTILYSVNLYQRELVEMPVGNPAVAPAPAAIQTYSIPTTDCANSNDARPFALAAHLDDPDIMYVGLTCSAETSGNVADLGAWVYEFHRSDGTFTPIFYTSLNYSRPRPIGSWGACSTNCPATWRPWEDDMSQMHIVLERTGGKMIWAHPQPMLADIAFDGPDLVLSIRDRMSDQGAVNLGNPFDFNDSRVYDSWQAGDMVRACAGGGGSWAWTMELNGVCGGIPGAGQGNTDGFVSSSDGEYYFDEYNDLGLHAELFSGGMVQVPGFASIAATAYDLNVINEGGISTWANATGLRITGAGLYASASAPHFGKANGVGDLEALCEAAPLEIGNRVWEDANGNGVQDPGEPILGGVTVYLYRDVDDNPNNGNEVLVGSTTTDLSTGQYLFNNDDVSEGILPDTHYLILIDPSDAALGGLNPTSPDASDDLRDSDGTVLSSSDANINGFVGVSISTGDAGANNHTYDFGFNSIPLSVVLTAFQAQAGEQGVLLTWETATEIDVLGFRLYRAESPGGLQIQLGEGTIASQEFGSPVGASYDFTDESVAEYTVYDYWLEVVDRHNGVARYGPETVETSSILRPANYRVFLPMIHR